MVPFQFKKQQEQKNAFQNTLKIQRNFHAVVGAGTGGRECRLCRQYSIGIPGGSFGTC